MSMREAGQRVQPNISRFTVSTIIRRFREENRIERLPHGGGRTGMFSPHQETLIVDMVRENNAIKLCEIQQKIIEDHVNFEGINSVSLSTVDRVLKRNRLRMKQLYRVPFDRNSDRVKEQRFQGFFNWVQWKDPMNTSTCMKLGLISPKGEGVAVM
ncbi:uncharacterized protein LOC122143832 isoform X2 [Cyprinus carpio]|uniref:Uncharacterized protein LOC122143832 isoform X2 n=1 Tax=Cyprinus carpio TaxID=7962 RepID=A0A9Q9XYI1_CYPCA|nr:uncharacterized protein LOC122143832 isoform X2 [Cyprinus carpio]